MRRVLAAGSLVLSLVAGGCSAESSPEEQARNGRELYGNYCAACHETDRGIGPRLTREVLATRRTAEALYRYNRRFMPYRNEGSLTDQQYWAVTAYLLRRERLLRGETLLGPETAAHVRLSDRPPER